MATRPVVIAVICVGLFIIIESWIVPKAMALRPNRYMMDDERSQKRRNYMSRSAVDRNVMRGYEKKGLSYDTELETIDPVTRIPDELAYFADYANTIEEFFTDMSGETRTRKRGNIQMQKKYEDQSLPDLSCSCQHTKNVQDMGDDTFPRYVVTWSCDAQQSGCTFPYTCQEILYPIVLLRKKSKGVNYSARVHNYTLLPQNLNYTWYAEYRNVSAGCYCSNRSKPTKNIS